MSDSPEPERDVLDELFTPAALALAHAELPQTRQLLRLDVLSWQPSGIGGSPA